VKDWFRRSTWTASDRAEFEARLARARVSGRAQYLRIQAVHLEETGRDDLLPPAVELLQRVVSTFPESIDVAPAHHLLGRCHERMGDTLLAVEAYRAAVQAERMRPGVRTDALLDFALLVAERKLTSLYSEADEVLGERAEDVPPFPIQRFKFHAAQALLADGRDPGVATQQAVLALQAAQATHSGFRYHQDLGLVGETHANLRQRLEVLAAG
jgi:tetratricopeptide (TPR) repeat protein